jgi:flagellar protein FlbD
MIEVTRLNGHPIAVNCDLVKFVEATPDTTLTLITGERLIVREPCGQVILLIAQWRSSVLRIAWPDASSALSSSVSNEVLQLPTPPGE